MCPVCLVFFFGVIKPGCVFYTYTTVFFNEKRQTTVTSGIQSSPVCVRSPTLLRLPGSTMQSQYLLHFQPIPVLRLHDHSNHLLLHLPETFGEMVLYDFVRPLDGPPSLNVNLTLKSQESCKDDRGRFQKQQTSIAVNSPAIPDLGVRLLPLPLCS